MFDKIRVVIIYEMYLNYKGCQIYGIFGGFSGFLSLSTLTLMSIERFFIIRKPLNALKSQTRSIIGIRGVIIKNRIIWYYIVYFTKVKIVITWMYSLFWILIQFVFGKKFVLEGILTSCTWVFTFYLWSV